MKMQFEFDQRVDSAIGKSIRAALRFYNQIGKEAAARGESANPPNYEEFSTMAKGLMQATMQVDMDRLKNPGMKEVFERTWAQKLLNFSTQRALKDTYELLMRRYRRFPASQRP